MPYLSLADSKGDPIPDGTYAYELRVVQRLDRGVPEKLTKAPPVQSGHFSVQRGSFVKPNPVQSPLLPTKDYSVNDDLVVQGQDGPVLTLLGDLGTLLQIRFDNTDCCHPSTHDWALQANDTSDSTGDFMIRDLTNGTVPVRIGNYAPDNALTVSPSSGNIGLGTLTPAVHLDVKANAAGQATERLQNSSATGYSGTEYLDNAGNVDLFFGIDNAASTTRLNSVNNNPIVVLTNSTERMRVTSAGNVGIGTASPANHLHVTGSAGTNKALIEETSGTTTAREILEIRNNGAPVLIYKDTSVAQRWSNGTLGGNFFIDEQAHTGVEFSLTNTGNLTIAGTLTQGSSRDLKTDFTSLDPKDVLARVSALPVSLWSYKTENAVRHVGPMAEDFHQAFGLGADDKHIAPGDQAGVALLAVQGLDQLLQSKGQEIATLQRENADLAKRVEALEAMLSKVMSAKATPDEQTP